MIIIIIIIVISVTNYSSREQPNDVRFECMSAESNSKYI